ncbi:MAG: class I SAM-dependent methyltransferase [Bryobacteraceae bacterium]|nr:class I SAM-dependent methyltransferase [Bryobacteraceae bacterium]
MIASAPTAPAAGGRFTLQTSDPALLRRLLGQGPVALASAFVSGELEVRGDLVAATRLYGGLQSANGFHRIAALVRVILPWLREHVAQTGVRASRNVRAHYDRSNDFYRQFLDERMVYSCAYFRRPEMSLDEAQVAKLDHICRKMGLTKGRRFLDIGCGWGGLALHACSRYGARADGCTLSPQQAAWARSAAADQGLESRVRIFECDYRDLAPAYDSIASVGMFEHVGRARLEEYFARARALLAPGGVFLNHGITRPERISTNLTTRLWQQAVFPGSQLVHLGEAVRAAERAGFEALDVENLRPHYALTCRHWVARLRQNREACLRIVDQRTYGAWLLVLAGAAASFEDGGMDVFQVLLASRGSPARPLTRDYMYAPPRREEARFSCR